MGATLALRHGSGPRINGQIVAKRLSFPPGVQSESMMLRLALQHSRFNLTEIITSPSYPVMRGLDPRIHALQRKSWMAGSSQIKSGHDEETSCRNLL
jgi:hypothetical protein